MSKPEQQKNDDKSESANRNDLLEYIQKMLASLRSMSVGLGEARLAHQIALAEMEAAFTKKGP